jgi:hypothetical protein
MNRILGTILFLALLGTAWNIIALLLHLAGLDLPMVHNGMVL